MSLLILVVSAHHPVDRGHAEHSAVVSVMRRQCDSIEAAIAATTEQKAPFLNGMETVQLAEVIL
jgi:hypothetical protein